MAYEYKSFRWYSEWEKRYFWCNTLSQNGKVVWKVVNSNNEIGEKNAIAMYHAKLMGGK